MITPTFLDWNMRNKRIFLRADLNVPLLSDGTIVSDFRLQAILPTIDYIINNNGAVVLATHMGRPKNKEPHLSTKNLLPWFQKRGYSIEFVEDIITIASTPLLPRHIVLMENLRFFSGEQNADLLFAKQLARCAHYYINDAFGTIHLYDCSTAVLPFEFPEHRRSIGFLVAKELHALESLKRNPSHPFIAILGGSKMKDKIPLIRQLLPYIDTIFIYPALCFTFLKALQIPVGKSLVEDDMIEHCKALLRDAENHQVRVVFPQDYQISYNSMEGPFILWPYDTVPENGIGIAIGPQSIEQCAQEIKKAQTIFLNCAMGFPEKPETRISTKEIIGCMAKSSAMTVIAGGDSVDCALRTPGYSAISHLSTGGGAALAYLSGTSLPGLIPFEEQIVY